MGTMASQITSLTIVYSTVYSDADQRKHQSSTLLASDAENVSIWWRHHGLPWVCDFYMKLIQYNECLISIVDTDGLVLQHQGISSHSADYVPMRFPVFMG